MVIKLLSSMPTGVDIDLSVPDGIRLISWSTNENKYTYEIWAKGNIGPYEVWVRNVRRAHFAGGPGRPRWRKVSTHSVFPVALEDAIEARKSCTFGGEPRAFVIRYLHETLERMVYGKEGR